MKRLFTFILLFSAVFGFAQTDNYSNVRKLYESGQLLEAEKAMTEKSSQNNGDYYQLYGDILLKKGNNQKALEAFENAQRLYTKSNAEPEVLANCYSQLGVSNWVMSNHNESLKYHQKALEVHKNNKNKKGIAASYNNIGLTYSNYDAKKAIEYYEKALTLYEDIYEADDEKIATAHINIGIINSKDEQLRDALTHFNKALKILEKKHGKEHPTQAFIYSNIGILKYKKEEYDEALNYQQQALAIYKKSYGDKHPEVSNTFNAIGNIFLAQKSYSDALGQYQKAICANIPNYSNTNIYEVTPVTNYYNPDLLLVSLQLKAQSFESLHFEKTLKKRDLLAAWRNFTSCDTLLEDMRRLKSNESDKIALGEKANEIYEDGIRTSLALADISWKKNAFEEKAFYFAEKSKSTVLLDAIADANAKSFANIPDNIVKEEQQLKSDIAYYKQLIAKSPDPTHNNQLFLLEKSYQEFVKKLENNYPEYYNLKYNTSIPSVSKIQFLIDDNEAVLSYFIGDKNKRIYTFYISKKQYRITNLPKNNNFDKALSSFRNSIYYNVKDSFIVAATALYKQLIPSIEKNIQSLTIIPVGQLGIIPFEALLTDKVDDQTNGFDQLPYLIKQYQINLQYAAALLTAKQQNIKRTSSACIFAPVAFEQPLLPDLPATETEAKLLNQIFKSNGVSSTLYTYKKANEYTIKSNEIGNHQFLHFATHGIVDAKHPELSQIYLSSHSDEDGDLYTGEIYNLKLNTELVTLSACETGLGKIYKGEGIMGLSRALLYAGAQNMMVSLWGVADQSTADFMVLFYDNALQLNSYKAGLQVAKTQMIKQKKYSSPFYWAPFILVGR